MTFLRTTLFLLVISQFAVAPSAIDTQPPFLIVGVEINVESDVASAINVRDLEHFVVAQLLASRVERVLPSSSVGEIEPTEAYVLTLTIEQLEEASRPRWKWSDRRYVDDDMLHLELSLTLTRADGAIAGCLRDIRDYRAEDFGRFTEVEPVRAVVFQGAVKLTNRFVSAATEGDFGEALRSIQRSETPADFINDWQELPLEWKFLSVVAAGLLSIFLAGIFVHLLFIASRVASFVLFPRGLHRQPAAYVLDQDDEESGS